MNYDDTGRPSRLSTRGKPEGGAMNNYTDNMLVRYAYDPQGLHEGMSPEEFLQHLEDIQ